MMYDELRGNLMAHATHFSVHDETSLLLLKAADAIEDLQKQLEGSYNSGYTHGLDDAAEVDLVKKMSYWWIPVTERLPDHRTTCLIVDDGVVVVGWRNLIGEWYDVAGDRLKYVTHWMPLPEPPESEGT